MTRGYSGKGTLGIVLVVVGILLIGNSLLDVVQRWMQDV